MAEWLSDWVTDSLSQWLTVWPDKQGLTGNANDWLAAWLVRQGLSAWWLSNWMTKWLSDWLTESLNQWVSDQPHKQSLVSQANDWLTAWLVRQGLSVWWLSDWVTECLTDWITESMTDCLAKETMHVLQGQALTDWLTHKEHRLTSSLGNYVFSCYSKCKNVVILSQKRFHIIVLCVRSWCTKRGGVGVGWTLSLSFN